MWAGRGNIYGSEAVTWLGRCLKAQKSEFRVIQNFALPTDLPTQPPLKSLGQRLKRRNVTKEEVMKQNKLLKPKNFLSKEFEICHLQTDYITLPDESEKIGCWPCGYRRKIQVIRKCQTSIFQICLHQILKNRKSSNLLISVSA